MVLQIFHPRYTVDPYPEHFFPVLCVGTVELGKGSKVGSVELGVARRTMLDIAKRNVSPGPAEKDLYIGPCQD